MSLLYAWKRACSKSNWKLGLISLGLGFCFCPLLAAQDVANSRYDTLVSSGDEIPGGGEDFSFFSKATMSANGNWVGFEGDYSGSGRGLFRYSVASGNLDQAIADGDSLSGGNFSMALGGRQLSINNSGTLGFNARLINTGSTNNDTGIYSWSGGAVNELVREGNAAPGGSGGTFQNFGTGFTDAKFRGLDEQGETIFTDSISDSPGGLTDDWRLFRVGSTFPPIAIASEGDSAPNGGSYGQFQIPELNDFGEAAISGSVFGANVGTKIWKLSNDGTMTELATALVTGGTLTSEGSLRAISGTPTISNNGDIAFVGWTSVGGNSSDDTHLFRIDDSGGISKLISEGLAAPDGNGEFANIINLQPRYNDAGQYASGFDLRNTSSGASDDSGIFRVDGPDNVVSIFREGQAALSGNGTFGVMNGTQAFAFNNAGNVAMETIYSGTAGGNSDNVAIVISDGVDSFEVAREGNTVAGQTVLGVDFEGATLSNHRTTSGLNDFGQVLYTQTLSGNNRSLVLWTPELHHRGGDSDFGDSSKWTLSLGPAHVHDVYLDSNVNSTVTVNGFHSVKSLQVGGGSGMAVLSLAENADLHVEDDLFLTTNGSIEMGSNSSLVVQQLMGVGSMSGTDSSELTVSELLAPGNSPGVLNFSGDLVLTDSTLTEIELGGTSLGAFDQIAGLDELTIDGALQVELVDGFSLAGGMEFEIFDVLGSATGQFDGLAEGSLVGNFGGTDLFISYMGGSGANVTLFTTAAVPEPATAGLLGMGLCGLLVRRKRRS